MHSNLRYVYHWAFCYSNVITHFQCRSFIGTCAFCRTVHVLYLTMLLDLTGWEIKWIMTSLWCLKWNAVINALSVTFQTLWGQNAELLSGAHCPASCPLIESCVHQSRITGFERNLLSMSAKWDGQRWKSSGASSSNDIF